MTGDNGEGSVAERHWSAEMDATLRRERARGTSATQMMLVIFQEHGVAMSRNAICGRIHRLGLSLIGPSRPRVTQEQRATRVAEKDSRRAARRAENLAAFRAGRRPALVASAGPVEPKYVALAELQGGQCRYPYGDGPYTFCGLPTAGSGPYCRHHHGLAYDRAAPGTAKAAYCDGARVVGPGSARPETAS